MEQRKTPWGRIFGSFRGSFLPMAARSAVRAEEVPPAEAPRPEEKKPEEEPAVQFEFIQKEWQNISLQDNWDGFRIEAQNKVTETLQATHSIFLGTRLRECGYLYHFGSVFQSPDQRTVLLARAGLDGGVNGRIIQKFGSCWEVKASSNSDLKDVGRNMHESSVEYSGPERALCGKLAWQGAWVGGGSFVQKILPQLQMGGDLTLVGVNGVTSIGQVGLRYAEGKNILTATLSRTPPSGMPGSPGQVHELKMYFVRKVTERLNLGTEFKFSYPDKDSGLSLGYEYIFRNARIQGLLDTDGKVSCCVHDAMGFSFSGVIDYARGDYKFGMVMQVAPQPEPGQQPPL